MKRRKWWLLKNDHSVFEVDGVREEEGSNLTSSQVLSKIMHTAFDLFQA